MFDPLHELTKRPAHRFEGLEISIAQTTGCEPTHVTIRLDERDIHSFTSGIDCSRDSSRCSTIDDHVEISRSHFGYKGVYKQQRQEVSLHRSFSRV